MEAEADSSGQALRRVYRIMPWLTGVVAVGTSVWKGPLTGFAFLLGAVAAYLNFSWLHQMVEGLGPGGRPPRKRVYVLFLLRFGLLAVGGYVIVKIFGMNGIAALAGLFVPVAAVTVEILYELVHGT
jgi:ATP synthase I chain